MISINLNNKENLKLTPIFVKNRIPYIRNENNGCITIALPEKRIPQYKILNKSAVEFSNLMDGTNTVQMILDLLAKKIRRKSSHRYNSRYGHSAFDFFKFETYYF